ncbi:MAG: prepilin peptidase [Kiritimatiellia bacterium]|jgi:leader peptidase (prepilin peptidase)/N-methyltransferase
MPLTPDLWLICTIFAAFFGACVGSFLNVCIYRIPLDQSVVAPRSHCMTCNKPIPWYHNLPVVSYFVLRGRCANCKAPFSFRYAAVELLVSALFVLACCMAPPLVARPPLGIVPLPGGVAAVPVAWVFLSGLVVATFVDLDHFIIPDSVTIGGMVAGLVFSALVPALHGAELWWQGLLASAIGLAAGFAPLQAIRVVGTAIYRRKGRIGPDDYAMGFGDIKFIGAIGAFLGWQGAAFSIMAAALYGTLLALPLLVTGNRKLLDRIPFGPYLALGAFTWMLWGPRLVAAYVAMLAPAA